MKRDLIIYILFVVVCGSARANNLISVAELDSCELAEYSLSGMQTVYGKVGLQLAEADIPQNKDERYYTYIKYFCIDLEKLFIATANAFSEERIRELSEKGCNIYPYMYFDTLGMNVENYFYLNKGQRFEPKEICTLDSTIKK